MRTTSALGAAALLAVLPVAVHAQTATATESVTEKNTTIVIKEAPKPSPVTFTPYGFVLLNAFFNDSAGARNYPFPSVCTGGAQCEGNILMDVRQSRVGTRLAFNDKAGWTGATLSALLEIDFQGGYNGTPTGSFGFYSPIVRLRKAYMDAAWGTESKFTIRAGQDDILTSQLRPVSLAYIANPLFQYAGDLNGRSPMIALRYDLTPKNGLNVSAAVAIANPQDNTSADYGSQPGAAIDLGAGNRSRMPSFQGRVGAGFAKDGKQIAFVNVWGGLQKERFIQTSDDTAQDSTASIIGGDLTLNLWMFQALASGYSAKGWDQPGALGASQGILPSATLVPGKTTYTINSLTAAQALGGWFQLSVRPIDAVQIYGGWGGTQSGMNQYAGTLFQSTAATAAATRVQNFTWAAGVIGYAGKNWRFSAEYARSTSYFLSSSDFSQGQFSINSQLVF